MKRVSLTQFKENRAGRVVEILGGGGLVNKLMGMGLYPGKDIRKLSHVGLKGPVVVKIGRSILALGHSVAERIVVEAAA